MTHIKLDNIFKIFGQKSGKAYEMLKKGVDKTSIFSECQATVGVNNASFEVQDGEVFVLMGLSGSGKSTLIRLINRIIEPTAGSVIINDTDVTSLNKRELRDFRRKNIAMVFQNFALLPHQKVWENAAFSLEISGVNKKERRKKALETLEKVGLHKEADLYPRQLSGGMQQRVGIARALCSGASILLMDEAFSALDPLIRRDMQDELLSLQKQEGTTIIFVSHDLEEAVRIGDRIAIMRDGGIDQIASAEHMLFEPKNDYVKDFFKSIDVTQVMSSSSLADSENITVIQENKTASEALIRLEEESSDFAIIIDDTGKYKGIVEKHTVIKKASSLASAVVEDLVVAKRAIGQEKKINEAIAVIANSTYPVAVVAKDQTFKGCISDKQIVKAINKYE